MKKIDLCITTYNRLEETLASFADVYSDNRIENIIIVDDASEDAIFEQLKSILQYYPKVKLYKNRQNIDCYFNKAKSLEFAANDYCILLDSDNVIGVDYLDKVYQQEWDSETFLMPDWAKPTFTYQEFSGLEITRHNVAQYMDRPFFSTLLNCANYFVNRHTYLKCFDPSFNPHTADSIFINHNLLAMGGKIKVVEGMSYSHLIHDGSHFKLNCHKTGDTYENIENKLRNMK